MSGGEQARRRSARRNSAWGAIRSRRVNRLPSVLLALLLVGFSAPLLVGFSAPLAAAQGATTATVRVDGRTVFHVAAADTLDEDARARRIERRIEQLLERPDAVGQVRVLAGPGPAERTLAVSGVPVVTVTAADAEEHLTTPMVLASQWAAALDSALERARGRRQSPGSRFVADVQASVEGALGRLLDSAVTIIPRALAAFLVLAFFGVLAAGVRRLMRALFRRVVDDLTFENLVKQVAYFAVWALGFVVALGALGLEPEAAVAGLGLTGLALGFALKDILSNFVAGLILLALRPFRISDQIVVGETEGAVERITLRATEIRTYGGRLVLVPNAEVFTSRVTNNTASPVRRGSVSLFIGYDEDLRVAVDALAEAARRSDGVLDEPAPSVRIRTLGASDIELSLRFWTDSRRSDFVATASQVRAAAVEALRTAGIGLPGPGRHVVEPGRAEAWRAVLGAARPPEREGPEREG
jgi:small conductance mechanosensitive channel